VPDEDGAPPGGHGRREDGGQVAGEGVGMDRLPLRPLAVAVPALVVGDDVVIDGEPPQHRGPEPGRAGPPVGEDDDRGTGHPVPLHGDLHTVARGDAQLLAGLRRSEVER